MKNAFLLSTALLAAQPVFAQTDNNEGAIGECSVSDGQINLTMNEGDFAGRPISIASQEDGLMVTVGDETLDLPLSPVEGTAILASAYGNAVNASLNNKGVFEGYSDKPTLTITGFQTFLGIGLNANGGLDVATTVDGRLDSADETAFISCNLEN